jgi:hypothetical protein
VAVIPTRGTGSVPRPGPHRLAQDQVDLVGDPAGGRLATDGATATRRTLAGKVAWGNASSSTRAFWPA